MPTQLYIRFKDIPENEVSGVYDGDLGRIRDEEGVAVFASVQIGDTYKIVLPSLCSGVLYDLMNFTDDAKQGKLPVYLVQGREVGTGTHGEPVIKDVIIVSKLKIVETTKPIPVYKMDKTSIQFIRDS